MENQNGKRLTKEDLESGKVVDCRRRNDASLLSVSDGPNIMVPPGETNWVVPLVSEQFELEKGLELVVGDLLVGSDHFVEIMFDLPGAGTIKIKHFPGENKAWLQVNLPYYRHLAKVFPKRQLHLRSTPWNIGGKAISFGGPRSHEEGDEKDG